MLESLHAQDVRLGYPSGRRTRFFDDSLRHPKALGCTNCPDHPTCGGLHVGSGAFNCLSYCCRQPDACDSVCVGNLTRFVARVREVGGFDLNDIPRSQQVPRTPLPALVPMIYHGSNRTTPFFAPTIALSLYSLIDRRRQRVKFTSRGLLCEAFRISPRSRVLITGVHDDRPLERWWALGPKRQRILDQLVELGITEITSPNYSLFSNTPRWNNLHAMKRIAITWNEMLSAGLSSGLHLNGRTDRDWTRWRDFVVERPEVTSLAFEFATGASNPDRMQWYADHLCRLAGEVTRSLTLVLRGGAAIVPQLRQAFASVCLIDTRPFIKAVKRQRALLQTGGRVEWRSTATSGSASIDDLLIHNYRCVVYGHLASHGANSNRNQKSLPTGTLSKLGSGQAGAPFDLQQVVT